MQPVKEYTFDNFIIGIPNQFAFMAAKAVADNPGETYNPLFIYGESGLGKTHLLNAVYNRLHESSPDTVVFMYKAEELIQEMVLAIKAKQTTAWREIIRSADVLLIDDAQVLMGKQATQGEFVALLRSYVSKKGQVVLTASVEPETLPAQEAGLRADFDQGLIADVPPLDIETCRMVALDKASRCGLRLSEDSMDCIVSHAKGEVRRLEGIVNRILAGKDLMGANVDLAAVKQVYLQADGNVVLYPRK